MIQWNKEGWEKIVPAVEKENSQHYQYLAGKAKIMVVHRVLGGEDDKVIEGYKKFLDDLDFDREFQRKDLEKSKGGIVEVEHLNINSMRATSSIGKFRLPENNNKMVYVGGLVVEVSEKEYYTFTIMSVEQEPTGGRESTVQVALFAKGELEKDLKGWAADPYDIQHAPENSFLRNLSDDEQYDKDFPDHPLTTVREVKKELVESLKKD